MPWTRLAYNWASAVASPFLGSNDGIKMMPVFPSARRTTGALEGRQGINDNVFGSFPVSETCR